MVFRVRPTHEPVLELAEQIVRGADREHPADQVLREALRARRDLTPADTAQVSSLVFAYFRWYGWVRQEQPVKQQLQKSKQLAERYATEPQNFPDAELVRYCVPAWVKEEMEVTPPWARALQSEPKLWLRARAGRGPELAKKLSDCVPFGTGSLADALEYRGRLDLFRTPEFHRGEFELQDLSSQAVGLVCAPRPGQIWWDACAGEGGKLLHLSRLMANQGLIWASDRATWRLRQLKRRAARAQVFNYRAAGWDGGAKLPTKTKFDGVLVDAPCSGVGTWHRNPHARWTTTPRDVQELSRLQQQLLSNAAQALKPGGKLIYAVCTLTRSETTSVASNFDQQHPDWERLNLGNPLLAESAHRRQLVIWPQDCGSNGMFIAAWRRKQ